MNKKIYIFILSALFFTAAPAFADGPVSSPDDKSAVVNTQTSYLYDLKKLIEKSRENIKEVNQKIKEQAILKRNQKREERAREYYEKGVALTNEGKLNEAREYFEKAIRITEHPEMAGYIRESQRRLRKQESALQAQEREHYNQIKQDENARKEDVEAAYKEAVDLYKQKKYHPAKDAFEHVDEIAPDYRATTSYLKIIDQDIILADALAAKQQAIEISRQQNEAEAARAKEKQMWLAQIEEKEKERKDAVNQQAQEVYDEAVALYKKKKFAEAKKKFEEVSWVIPDYKATVKYLKRIDKDAQAEQERVAKQQQRALQEQRWQEEVDRKKQEDQRRKELEVKERQHKIDIQEQAQFLYRAAVSLFNNKNMDEALQKFNDIEKLSPGFKSTRTYIARIEQMAIDKQRAAQLQQKRLQESAKREEENKLRQQEITERKEQEQELKDKMAQAQRIAKSQSAVVPTPAPLPKVVPLPEKVETAPAPEPVPLPAPVEVKQTPPAAPSIVIASPEGEAISERTTNSVKVESAMPPAIKVAVSLQDQQRQAQDIAALAEKSAQLYHQIADIADDKSTVQAKKKMAQVNDMINKLKENKERLLIQLREEQFQRLQQEAKAKKGERRLAGEKLYQEGVEFLRSHQYAKAKIKFLALEDMMPDYKATRRYLSRIEKAQKRLNFEAITDYEKNQALHLKRLQEKENINQQLLARQDEEKRRSLEQQQEASLNELTQKASAINDDIIRLSKAQDYEGMKLKFAELENTVTALTTLKDAMAKEKDRQQRNKELARESATQRANLLEGQKREDQQIHAYYNVQPLKEYRPELSSQPPDADYFKRREIMQEQNMLFSEGVDRYEHQKYTQAKLLFGELADQHDRRAEAWLKKVDRAITRELLKSQAGEERERTAFIADQLKAQRQLMKIQERERQRQKKLTEELEHQRRLYEDDRLSQLRKEETMKTQERERQRHEEKRLKLEKESKKEQEMFRFHKISTAVNQPPAVKTQAPISSKPQTAAVAPIAMTPKQLQAQIDFSNKRKSFLDNKYKKEQREKARQAKIKAAADARQKRLEERQKEREHRKELKAQREKARQDKIKAAAEVKAQQAKDKAEKLAQEQKHREELLQNQEQQHQEKIKQEEIVRQEAQRKSQLERQERERQSELEAQREAVRKQLEDGVEVMYQDALSLYRQGEYTAAAERFKDVQDILPGYKNTGEYLDQARMKSLAIKPQAEIAPEATQDKVSKALDLFDPNAK